MLNEPLFAKQAQRVAHRLESEDGVGAACDALEELNRNRATLNRP
jgi:UDP:flavonoid glycosyltransferase YjiC (YdhE family)